LQIKEDLGLKLEESEARTHRELSKLLDDTTQAIEDSINGNLVAQMKELDEAMQGLTARVVALEQMG